MNLFSYTLKTSDILYNILCLAIVMAALVVQSRFAGLKIEDDDYPSSSDVSKSKKPKQVVKKAEPPKKAAKTTNNNTNKTQVHASVF